jgi:phospholipid/cholesterol/gamma-HCH transport system substrate-binding protein
MANNTKLQVGVFMLITLLTFFIGISFLKNKKILSKQNTYYIMYNEAAGIVKGSDVMIKGVKIGSVTETSLLNEDNINKVKIKIAIDKKITIKKNAKALIKTGLIGKSCIEIDQPNEPNEILKNNGFIECYKEIKKAGGRELNNAINNIDMFTANLLESQVKINSIINDLQSITQATKLTLNINNTGEKINKVIENLANEKTGIPHVMKNLNTIVNSLDPNKINNIINTLENISQKIQEGEGTIGKLVYDQEVYENLKTSLVSLDDLLKNIKNKPKRYLHFSILGLNNDNKKNKANS